jgi:hypothetical protein
MLSIAVASFAAQQISTPDAWACGACVHHFSPGSGRGVAPQVVTDHRIVMALSSSRTVLWDQFQFSPSDQGFAWIFPIHAGSNVQVDVDDPGFVAALDRETVPLIACSGSRGGANQPMTQFGPSFSMPNEPIPPAMMTTVIHDGDPMTIFDWITAQGYVVPGSIQQNPDGAIGDNHMPTALDYYVTQHMDFVTVQFAPTTYVRLMPPVRITLDGYDPELPLRGISVGGTEQVGVVLMVLASSRVDVTGFPNARLDQALFEVGGLQPDAFYGAALDSLRTQFGRDVWVTESALSFPVNDLRRALLAPDHPDAAADIDASTSLPSALDLDTALNGIEPTVVVTRLHSSVPTLELTRELVLESASDNSVVGRDYTFASFRCGSGDAGGADTGRAHDLPPSAACLCTTPGAVPCSSLRPWLAAFVISTAIVGARRRSRSMRSLRP